MTHEEIFSYNKFVPNLPLEKPFYYAANGLAHGHINCMYNDMLKAGATLKYIYDEDEALCEQYAKMYPNAIVAKSYEEILSDPEIELVASAAIPERRANIAIEAMKAGKHAFVDKAPVITFEQLEAVKKTVKETGMKYFVYYGEFVSVEASVYAKQLVDRGIIGDVFHMDIVAPHRLNAPTRPDWFFKRHETGGIITDIGSHQLYQFFEFSGAKDAKIESARVANFFASEYASAEEFDDFGDLTITGDNGVTGYVRIDWNSPAGIKTWGDVRVVIQGSKGYIELRKNCDISKMPGGGNTVYVCTDDGVFTETVGGKVGLPYCSNLINDCRNGTDTAMDPFIAFRAIELSMEAQEIGLKNSK